MLASYRRVMQEARRQRAWGWCANGHHADCRVEMPDGCGGYDLCGCACHTADAFDRAIDSEITREREREAEA